MTRVSIDQSDILCAKCGQKKQLVRHHMGNDRFLGFWNKRLKKEYYEYNDAVKVCDDCHMHIHWLYNIEMGKWHQKKWTPRGVLSLRTRLIEMCRLWLAGGYDPVKVDVSFKLRWEKSVRKYRKTRS